MAMLQFRVPMVVSFQTCAFHSSITPDCFVVIKLCWCAGITLFNAQGCRLCSDACKEHFVLAIMSAAYFALGPGHAGVGADVCADNQPSSAEYSEGRAEAVCVDKTGALGVVKDISRARIVPRRS